MDRTIGVLGGGQLGRMLTEAANRLNVKVLTLDSEGSPAKQINARPDHVDGSFTDSQAILQLAERCDVLTVEIEHVDTDVLESLSRGTNTRDDWRLVKSTKIEVQPSWKTIRTIQDKFHQKEHLLQHGIPTAHSQPVENHSNEELEQIAKQLGYPFMLKSRTEAYDGRGNYPIKSAADLRTGLAALRNRPLYAEQWADFTKELAVMVIKTEDEASDDWENATKSFPVVETIHEDSICKLVYAPARDVSDSTMKKAQDLARRAVAGFLGKGVFGVEMFLLGDESLLVNEIAPRPHNSGHYTVEACPLSQYDAQIRAILDLPIPEESTQLLSTNTYAIMLNILGGAQTNSHLAAAQEALSIPGARVHLYGKGDARPGRKMGHVTVLATSMVEAQSRIDPLVKLVDQIRAQRNEPQSTLTMKLKQAPESQKASQGHPNNWGSPLVAVTMGSDSDRFVLAPGITLLRELEIPHSVTITSAHRTPERMFEFARNAAPKGVKVIIAAAGGAAHLPGMVAAITRLPVIGVPVKGSVLDGIDSLLSIAQMPRGCPVATVAINNSVNAAQLAVRILAVSDLSIRKRLEKYLMDQTNSVLEKAERMERITFEAYGSEG